MAFNINAQIILSGPKNIQKVRSTIQTQLQSVNVPINIQLSKGLNSQINNLNKSLNTTVAVLNSISSAASKANTTLNQISSVSSQVATNSTKATNSISSVNRSLSQTSKNAAAATSSMRSFGKEAANAIKRFGAFSIATGAIYGFIRAIQNATGEALAFDREMVRLKQVTDASSTELSNMQKTIDGLSTSLGINANELAKVAVTLAQAGLSAKDTEAALKGIAKAALTPSFGNLQDTTEGVIAVLSQFGIAANKTEEVLGSINAVSKAFAVESEDLISVIRRAGGVFATAAGQMKEPQEALADLLGIFTAVRSTTRESADTIATGLRTIFSRLQRKGTIEFLKQFNIDLLDSEGKFVGFYESFKRISQGLQGLFAKGDTVTIAAIVEELGGIRQVGKLIPVITNFSRAEEARKVALQGTASLTKDVDIATQSLSVQIQQLQQRFSKLIRDIAGSTTFQNLAKFALSTANAFITVADTLKPLLPLLTTFAGIQISKSLAEFSLGFIGGFKKGGGAAGAGATVGGAVSGANQQATQQAAQATTQNTQAKTSNTQSINNNTTAINNLINGLGTLGTNLTTANATLSTINTAISNIPNIISSLTGGLNAVSSSITNLITAIKSIPISPPVGRTAPVKGFARGGVVPGTGNRDTVPAMLTPGEFVIKKSSVKSIGADTLTAMNENKLAGGSTGRGAQPREIVGATNPEKLRSKQKRNEEGIKETVPGPANIIFDVIPGQIGGFALGPQKGVTGDTFAPSQDVSAILPPTNRLAKFIALQAGLNPDTDIPAGINAKIMTSQAQFPIFYPGDRTNLKKNAAYQDAVRQGTIAGLTAGIKKTADTVAAKQLLDVPPAFQTDENLILNAVNSATSDSQVTSTIDGYIFESMITALTGAIASGDQANFDFSREQISSNRNKLSALFGNDPRIQGLLKAEAKRSRDKMGSIPNKLKNEVQSGQLSNSEVKSGKLSGLRLRTTGVQKGVRSTIKKASGGDISGTDTVPALLTPGEFVINKDAASRIGYGNLDTMNKTGVSKFAKGGIVGFQKFAGGTPRQGAQPLPAQDIQLSNINMTDVNAQTKSLADILKNINSTFSKTNTDASELEKLNKLLVDVSNEILSDAKNNVPLWKKISKSLGLASGNISNIAIPLEDISRILTVASGNVLYINKDFEIINQHGRDLALNMQGAVNKSKIMLQGINPNFNPNFGVATGTTSPRTSTVAPVVKSPDFSALEQEAKKIAKIAGDTSVNMGRLSKSLTEAGVSFDAIKQAELKYTQSLTAGSSQLDALLAAVNAAQSSMNNLSSAANTTAGKITAAAPTPSTKPPKASAPVSVAVPAATTTATAPTSPPAATSTPTKTKPGVNTDTVTKAVNNAANNYNNVVSDATAKMLAFSDVLSRLTVNSTKLVSSADQAQAAEQAFAQKLNQTGNVAEAVSAALKTLEQKAATATPKGSAPVAASATASATTGTQSSAAKTATALNKVGNSANNASKNLNSMSNSGAQGFANMAGQLGGLLFVLNGLKSLDFSTFEGFIQGIAMLTFAIQPIIGVMEMFGISLAANTAASDINATAKTAGAAADAEEAVASGVSSSADLSEAAASQAAATSNLLGGMGPLIAAAIIPALLLAMTLIVKPIANWIGKFFGRTEVGDTGIGGYQDKSSAKVQATGEAAAITALIGGAAVAAFGLIPGIAIAAFAAIPVLLTSIFKGLREQAKFEALSSLQSKSINLGLAFDRLGDKFDNAVLFDKANQAVDDLIQSTKQLSQAADYMPSAQELTGVDFGDFSGAANDIISGISNEVNASMGKGLLAGTWDLAKQGANQFVASGGVDNVLPAMGAVGFQASLLKGLGKAIGIDTDIVNSDAQKAYQQQINDQRQARANVVGSAARGEMFATGMSLIKQEDLDKAQKAYESFNKKIVEGLEPEQLTEFIDKAREATNLTELGDILTSITKDGGKAAEALKSYQKVLVLQQGKKVGEAIKKASEGDTVVDANKVKGLGDAFSELQKTFSDTGNIKASATAFNKRFISVLKNNLASEDGALKSAFEQLIGSIDITDTESLRRALQDVFASGDPKKIEMLTKAFGLNAAEAQGLSNEIFNGARNALSADKAMEIFNNAVQTKVSQSLKKAIEDIDALAAALGVLSKGVSGAVGDFSNAASNIEARLNKITGGESGFIVNKQVNPFENTQNRTVEDLQAGFDRIAGVLSRGDETKKGEIKGTFTGLAAAAKIGDELPLALKKTVKAIESDLGSVANAGDISFEEFFTAFTNQLGDSFTQLPEVVQKNLRNTLANEFEAKRQESDTGTVGLEKIKDIITSETSEKLKESLTKLGEETRAKAAEVTNALNEFRDAILKGAALQSAIYEQIAQRDEKILSLRESFEDRFSKFFPSAISEREKAESRLSARVSSQVSAGGAAAAEEAAGRSLTPFTGGPNAADQLLQRRSELMAEQETLQKQAETVDQTTSPEGKALADALASNQKALEGNNKALETLSTDTTRLAAIEGDLAKIQESRLSARERTKLTASKLASAKSPQEVQQILQELVQPGLSAQKLAKGEQLTFQDVSNILANPKEAQTLTGMTDKELEDALAKANQAGAMGIQGLLGDFGASKNVKDMAARALNPGSTVAGSTEAEKGLKSQAEAIIAEQEKIITAISDSNITRIQAEQKVFQTELDKTYETLKTVSEQFAELRANMDDTIAALEKENEERKAKIEKDKAKKEEDKKAKEAEKARQLSTDVVSGQRYIEAQKAINKGGQELSKEDKAKYGDELRIMGMMSGDIGENLIKQSEQAAKDLGLNKDASLEDIYKTANEMKDSEQPESFKKLQRDLTYLQQQREKIVKPQAEGGFGMEFRDPRGVRGIDFTETRTLGGQTRTEQMSEIGIARNGQVTPTDQQKENARAKPTTVRTDVESKPEAPSSLLDSEREYRNSAKNSLGAVATEISSTLPDKNKAEIADEAIAMGREKGSFYVHDIHTEKVLLEILSALTSKDANVSLSNVESVATRSSRNNNTQLSAIEQDREIKEIARIPESERTDEQKAKLEEYRQSVKSGAEAINNNPNLLQEAFNATQPQQPQNMNGAFMATPVGGMMPISTAPEDFGNIMNVPTSLQNRTRGGGKIAQQQDVNKQLKSLGMFENTDFMKYAQSQGSEMLASGGFKNAEQARKVYAEYQQQQLEKQNIQQGQQPGIATGQTQNEQDLLNQRMKDPGANLMPTFDALKTTLDTFTAQLNASTFIAQLTQAADTLKNLPALTVQLETNNSKIEVVLNGIEMMKEFGETMKQQMIEQVMSKLAEQGVRGSNAASETSNGISSRGGL